MRDLYRPSQLAQFLQEINASPQKRLSQNFLIDGNIIRKIIASVEVKKGDSILEIGPGPGVLTEELLHQGATVVAIEKDRKFSEALHRLQTEDKRLKVVQGDALTWDGFTSLPAQTKIVANLPYHITTPLLTHLLPLREVFHSITVMIQKEVADRIVAKPGTKAYGSLSVFAQFYSHPSKQFVVTPTCFYPPPKVHSTVVSFLLTEREKTLLKSTEDRFFAMTRHLFQHRRKMIKTSLKEKYPTLEIESALRKMGKTVEVRPEELSLAEFLTLFHAIDTKHDNSSQ